MKEPKVKEQIEDAQKQYKDNLITKQELKEQLARIAHNYDEWLKRNQ